MTIDANLYPNSSGLIINQFLGVYANSETIDDSTGALQVWGGAAIKGNLFVGGISNFQNANLGNLAANAVTTSWYLTANLLVANNISNTGNITTANVFATGNILAVGNLVTSGNIIAAGNLRVANATIIGNIQAANVLITGTGTNPLSAITRSEAFGLSIAFGL